MENGVDRLRLYLPVLATLGVVLVLAAAALAVGFVDPRSSAEAASVGDAWLAAAGELADARPSAADISWRLRWSLSLCVWVVAGVFAAACLTGAMFEDTRLDHAHGVMLRRGGLLGASVTTAVILGLEMAGLALAGPLAEQLLSLPVLPFGSVAAVNALVNAVTGGMIVLLAFAYSAAGLIPRGSESASGAGGQTRSERLLVVGSLFLSATIVQVVMAYRWSAVAVADARFDDLAQAVSQAQPEVLGVVASLHLAVLHCSTPGAPPASATLGARAVRLALIALPLLCVKLV